MTNCDNRLNSRDFGMGAQISTLTNSLETSVDYANKGLFPGLAVQMLLASLGLARDGLMAEV